MSKATDGTQDLSQATPGGTNTKELDKILDEYWSDRKNTTGTQGGAHRKARRRIQSLLDEQTRLARIDELTEFYGWVTSEGRIHSEIAGEYIKRLNKLKAGRST